MPCHSSANSLTDAKIVVKKFKLNSKKIDLTKPFDSFTEILPRANELAVSNIKPRLRMITLYYFAAKFNYLVIGTGNKSEAMVGYFTKYGDGGVDILPIADLYKSQVVELAKKLGVPKSIIDKPPSADLWHGQTDEDEMGITYPEIEIALREITEGKRSELPRAKISKVKKMLKNSEHKRDMPEAYKA